MKRKNLLIGCGLTGALGLLVLFVLFVLAAKGCQGCVSGGPYPLVTESARTDARVADAVGGIVQIGAIPSGSVNYMNGEGHAEMNLAIDGEAHDAEYIAVVTKPRGASEWQITSAQLVLDDGTVITLDPPTP